MTEKEARRQAQEKSRRGTHGWYVFQIGDDFYESTDCDNVGAIVAWYWRGNETPIAATQD